MKSCLAAFLLLCLGCAAIAARAAAPTPIDIAPEARRVPLWQELRIVHPDDPLLAPEQAAALAAAEGAIRVDSPDRVIGRGSLPFWARFALHNPAASEQLRLLILETTTQFKVRLYRRDPGGAWRPAPSLEEVADGRLGGGTAHPVWELQLAPGQTQELLLRIEGPAVVRFPLFVEHPVAFAENERKRHVMIGLALGGCLFIGVYIGSLRRYLDDPSVPLFVCMVIANLVGALWLSGFLDEMFPGTEESRLSVIGFAAYAILFGCGNLHARIYLNLAAWAPRTDRLLQGLGWLWLWLAPWFALAFPVAARILNVWGGALVALTLFLVSLLAARRKIPYSAFIGAAWISNLLAGAAFLAARTLGNPLLWAPATLTLVQATVMAIFFGFAMSQRLMRQRDQLVEARREAVLQHEKAAAIARERSLIFAATNHDLRQPLMGVSMFANLLKLATKVSERREHAHKLDLALKEVDDILVSIQQLALVHESETPPALQTVRLDDLLLPAIEEYRARAEFKRITIRYVPTRLLIATHIPYFQRIFRNVLSNAIRYTNRGDRILIGCRRGGGMRLVISDTGRGMTAEQAQRAFDAFQRFDVDGTIPHGFGLGLFSTKALAQALGLTVKLQGYPRRGTVCSILIPASLVTAPGDRDRTPRPN